MVLTEVQKLHEECAVFGVSLQKHAQEEAPGICYNGLLAMQHRGQEGAGIAAARGNAIVCHKDVGLSLIHIYTIRKKPTGKAAVVCATRKRTYKSLLTTTT